MLSTIVALGCATAPPAPKTPEPDPAKPVGTKLIKDCVDSDKTYELAKNDGHGFGNVTVRLEGKPVWPPSGPGCERLIACCTPLASDDSLALACQFAVGRDRECAIAQQTIRQIVMENGLALPPSCRE
jgi:hypothetical protein